MKKIELFERAIAEQAGSLKEWGINQTLFWAYRNSIAAGNEEINFEDVIWDYDIGEITKTLKENGITGFTISSTFSIQSLLPWCRILTLVWEDSKGKNKKAGNSCSVRHFLIIYSHGVLP